MRARLTLAVARACSQDGLDLAETYAACIELIHCASLVHDDLPCFDDALLRRGQPTIHRRFGEAMAVLVGDALIVLAFEELSLAVARSPSGLGGVVGAFARGVGPGHGIVGGQGWELEEGVDLARYHRLKTAALFEAATAGGALAVGGDGEAWRATGRLLGEAYQLADDLADVFSDAGDMGKETGQDRRSMVPNAARRLGAAAALARLDAHVEAAKKAVPPCRDPGGLVVLIDEAALRLVPPRLRQRAGSHPAAQRNPLVRGDGP